MPKSKEKYRKWFKQVKKLQNLKKYKNNFDKSVIASCSQILVRKLKKL